MSLLSGPRKSSINPKIALLNAVILTGLPSVGSAETNQTAPRHSPAAASQARNLTLEEQRDELRDRFNALLRSVNREIDVNHYFLPIRRLRENSLRSLVKTTAAPLDNLAKAEGEAELQSACKNFEQLLLEHEEKFIEKGYLHTIKDFSLTETDPVVFDSKADGSFKQKLTSSDGTVYCIKSFRPIEGSIRLVESTTFWPNGALQSVAKFENDTLTYFDERMNPVGGVSFDKAGQTLERFMYDESGKRFGSYKKEFEKNPALSKDEYLAHLARNLNTPLKHHVFIRLLFNYVRDGEQSYLQSAHETMDRDAGGAMSGNCLDIAQFECEILRLQGNKPFIVSLGNKVHAATVLLSKSEGRYHGETYCNFSYDRNGIRIGKPADPERELGAETPEQALQWIFEKYDSIERLNAEDLRATHKLRIIELDQTNELSQKSYRTVALEDLIKANQNTEVASILKYSPDSGKKRLSLLH